MADTTETSSQSTPPMGSPQSILKKSKRTKRDQSITLGSLMEDAPLRDDPGKPVRGSVHTRDSLRNLRKSIAMKKEMAKAGIKFSDDIDVMRISFMSNSVADKCFWTDEELADFRHQAFMEECGLNAADFD